MFLKLFSVTTQHIFKKRFLVDVFLILLQNTNEILISYQYDI